MSHHITVDGIDYVYEVEEGDGTIITVSDDDGLVACMELDHNHESAHARWFYNHDALSNGAPLIDVRYWNFNDKPHEYVATWLVSSPF